MNEANTPAVEVQDEQTPLEHLVEVHELVHDKSAPDGGLVEYDKGFRNGVERSLSIMQSRDANYTDMPAEPEDRSETAESKLDEIDRKITNVRDIQGAEGTIEAGEYMRGMYNGLELALSIVQKRDAEYK